MLRSDIVTAIRQFEDDPEGAADEIMYRIHRDPPPPQVHILHNGTLILGVYASLEAASTVAARNPGSSIDRRKVESSPQFDAEGMTTEDRISRCTFRNEESGGVCFAIEKAHVWDGGVGVAHRFKPSEGRLRQRERFIRDLIQLCLDTEG